MCQNCHLQERRQKDSCGKIPLAYRKSKALELLCGRTNGIGRKDDSHEYFNSRKFEEILFFRGE